MWLQANVRGRGLGLWPRLYAGPVCDDSAAEVECVVTVALYE